MVTGQAGRTTAQVWTTGSVSMAWCLEKLRHAGQHRLERSGDGMIVMCDGYSHYPALRVCGIKTVIREYAVLTV